MGQLAKDVEKTTGSQCMGRRLPCQLSPAAIDTVTKASWGGEGFLHLLLQSIIRDTKQEGGQELRTEAETMEELHLP